MSLLGKIRDAKDSALLEASVQELEKERAKEQQILQLKEIIEDVLRQLAKTLEEELEVLEPGKIFKLGDIMLHVQLFQQNKKVLPNPEQPRLVVMEYVVSLIGVDSRSNSIEKVRVGTLKFFNYDGLFRTITEAPPYLVFDAEEVRKHHSDFRRL